MKQKGWLTDVGQNSWWHIKSSQHAAHNPKSPGGNTWKYKRRRPMVEDDHHLRNDPKPHNSKRYLQSMAANCSQKMFTLHYQLLWNNQCYHQHRLTIFTLNMCLRGGKYQITYTMFTLSKIQTSCQSCPIINNCSHKSGCCLMNYLKHLVLPLTCQKPTVSRSWLDLYDEW